MNESIEKGDCVKVSDGRIGRVRDYADSRYKVRVRRKTGKSHQFLELGREDIEKINCPKGWMSPDGYIRYLKTTLSKMEERKAVRQKS